ncbi:TCR/Tet family MFS transporter [Abyssibius alkaniclasticus]|uniref:TCR/Tet family MFS transporter n=1 Tax=Abyssibius alkaniclasticus TaxID=2881234 RepID=UPI00405A0F7F
MKPKAGLAFAIATILLDAIGVGLIFPIMPDLMAEVGAGDIGSSAIWGGILISAYAVMQFLFSPLIGNLSDAFGRRGVLLLALAALTLDYLLMALAQTFWLLLIGRIVAGIAGATYSTVTAYLADISAPAEKAANFGLISAVFGVGFILGPALGGLLAGVDLRAPFYAAAVLSAANFAFGWFFLPESLPKAARRPFSLRKSSPFTALRDAFALPALRVPLTVFMLFELAAFVYPAVWAYFGKASFGWSTVTVGISLTAYGALLFVVQGGLLRVLVPRWGERRVILFGMWMAFLGLFGIGLAPSSLVVFMLLPICALSDLAPPSLQGLMSNRVSDHEQGKLQGVIGSLGALISIAGPLIMTGTFWAFTSPSMPYIPGAPFFLAALITLAIIPMAWRKI